VAPGSPPTEAIQSAPEWQDCGRALRAPRTPVGAPDECGSGLAFILFSRQASSESRSGESKTIDGGHRPAMTSNDKAASNSRRDKRDGDERATELCECRDEVIAEHGLRGLKHGQVEHYAGS